MSNTAFINKVITTNYVLKSVKFMDNYQNIIIISSVKKVLE